MKKLAATLAMLAVAGGALCAQPAPAPAAPSPAVTNAPAREPLPGEKVAQTVSIITGVAISPLMGVGAVGAWEFYHATPAARARLPWYANPFFWVPALLVVAACFIKDVVGASLPAVLKKPFDVAEAIENKISALMAIGMFVPIAATIFGTNNPPAMAGLSSLGLAVIDLSPLANGFMVAGAMLIFLVVFLASNAINVLILLSPFSSVDLALKTLRTGVLASVCATAFVGPWLGAAWALVIIALCWLIAGWSFRLSHFGLAFIWDFVTGRCHRFQPARSANKMFLGRKFDAVPARSYGRLVRDDAGRLQFHYRPWLVLPPRVLTLPEGRYEAGRGVFYSELLRVEDQGVRTVLLLPPRYLGHEEDLVLIYRLAGTRDVGLRAAWSWLKGVFGGRQPVAPAA